jgi:hypothetical protein
MLRSSVDLPDPVARYFELDADHDLQGVAALFADEATVVDEGRTYRGLDEIRAWRLGPESKHTRPTAVTGTEAAGADRYLVIGRLDGNLPRRSAHVRWDFTVAGDRIERLVIAP